MELDRTDTYNTCVSDLGIPETVLRAIEGAVKGFNFTPAGDRATLIQRTKDYSIWNFRIPSPNRNKGASGGYRMVFFYLKQEDTSFLHWIAERSSLEKKHGKLNYDAMLKQLRSLLEERSAPITKS